MAPRFALRVFLAALEKLEEKSASSRKLTESSAKRARNQ
jgi:hypothetical protein